MELRVLRYFLIAAREENITHAAELLHLTQPTLSRQLIQLEKELGVSLFLRGKTSLTLTEDGMRLKRRAQELTELADKTLREFSHESGTLNGEISIGSGESLRVKTLADWIADFQKGNPFVQYHIYSATADEIQERLEKGLLDIGLLNEPVDISRYDFIRMPERERWGILVRGDSPLAALEAIRPENLIGVPLLFARRSAVRDELRGWFGEIFDQLTVAGTYNLIYNAAALAESGVGAVLCIEHGRDYPDLRFVPLLPKLETGTVLVWKKHQQFSPAAAAFLAHVQNAFQA